MYTHYTHEKSYVPTINRPHAPDQWQTRTPAELPLETAWRRAIPVRAPAVDGETVRLYAPYDVLLVVRAGVLRTVLYNDEQRTEDDHLSPCPGCEDLVDPLRDATCPWCETPLAGSPAPGQVAIVHGGGQR